MARTTHPVLLWWGTRFRRIARRVARAKPVPARRRANCSPGGHRPDSTRRGFAMKLLRAALPALAPSLVLGASLAACAPAAQQGAGAGSAPASAIDPARMAADVRTLASDEFLGRGPATPGEEKTVAYIAEQMRAAGLQPGGPNGSWYQDVPLNQSDIVGRPELSLTVAGRRQPLTQGEQI